MQYAYSIELIYSYYSGCSDAEIHHRAVTIFRSLNVVKWREFDNEQRNKCIFEHYLESCQ